MQNNLSKCWTCLVRDARDEYSLLGMWLGEKRFMFNILINQNGELGRKKGRALRNKFKEQVESGPDPRRLSLKHSDIRYHFVAYSQLVQIDVYLEQHIMAFVYENREKQQDSMIHVLEDVTSKKKIALEIANTLGNRKHQFVNTVPRGTKPKRFLGLFGSSIPPSKDSILLRT